MVTFGLMSAPWFAVRNSGAASITPGEISATITSRRSSSAPSSPAVTPMPQPITNEREGSSLSSAGMMPAKHMVG